VGALVFLGFLSSGSASKKIHAIPCRKNGRRSRPTDTWQAETSPTDLKKGTAVLTSAKGIFHPNFSGKKGPEKSGSL
jgi:hypothetical protein